MAPVTNRTGISQPARKPLRYVQNVTTLPNALTNKKIVSKRKAECSPPKGIASKRSVFVDIENVVGKIQPAGNIKKIGVARAPPPSRPQTRSYVNNTKVKAEPVQPSLKTNSAAPMRASAKSQQIVTEVTTVKTNTSTLVTTSKTILSKKNLTGQPQKNTKNVVAQQVQATQCKEKKDARIGTDIKDGKFSINGLFPVLKIPKIDATATNEDGVKQEGENKKSDAVNVKQLKRTSRSSVGSVRNSFAETTDGSFLFVSALEEVSSEIITVEKSEKIQRVSQLILPSLSEFDRELERDPNQLSLYAMEIFEYLKTRESHFKMVNYMTLQPYINNNMRAMLVDWMVDVQESFELNHETLYLGVKLVDSFLAKVKIHKTKLQLVGATALFLASKYDERLAPLIDDFISLSDNIYSPEQFIAMEQQMLRIVKFELSFPISYSFLRRYGRCAKIQMPLLTLARYILELGLMEYYMITISDSKQAAAVLYLALRMTKHSKWTESMEHYTGYKLEEFKDIVILFNKILHQKPSAQLMVIRNKYSHKVFFEVAKTPLLKDEDLDLNI